MQSEIFDFAIEMPLKSREQTSNAATFDEAFLAAVDSAFSMLGVAGARAVFKYLESNRGISRTAIPSNVGEFAKSIEALFGQAASLIEIRIMRALYQKFPLFDFHGGHRELSFVNYVEALRRFL
jgi:hypothetical protein